MPDITEAETAPPAPAALPVLEVAERVGYSSRYIRQLVAEGRFPPPIDPNVAKRAWRWSSSKIDQYVAGEWAAA